MEKKEKKRILEPPISWEGGPVPEGKGGKDF